MKRLNMEERILLLRKQAADALSGKGCEQRFRLYPGRTSVVLERDALRELAKAHGLTLMDLVICGTCTRSKRAPRDPDDDLIWRSPRGPMEIFVDHEVKGGL